MTGTGTGAAPALAPEQVRQLLAECVTVVAPGEVLVLRCPEGWTPEQAAAVQDCTRWWLEGDAPDIRVLVVPHLDMAVIQPESVKALNLALCGRMFEGGPAGVGSTRPGLGTDPAKDIGTMGNRTCDVEGCEEPYCGKGYCAVHYQRWRRWGDPLGARPPRQETCSFPGCEGKHDSHGYCSAHAAQLRKGQELRPLRPSWKGAECTAEPDCHQPVVARGYCRKHWRAWRKHGDPLVKLGAYRDAGRRYTLNAAYFDEVTTEAQAYWLGFIAADGGIIRSGRTFTLRVELAECDKDHVQLLADALGSNRPLSARRNQVLGSFDSWRLIESLGRLGIGPRKSATVEPWAGPAELMPHYWRGLFDGDGSIYRNSSRSDWYLNICGSRACVEGFAAWAKPICGSRAQPRVAKGECWSWAVGGGRAPQYLARALYGNATVSLARKRERAAQLIAMDYDALKTTADQRRADAVREAWRTGTHPRSTAARS